jgi:hypothetical protein
MKEPRSFNKPRLYYQEALDRNGYQLPDRIRIIYPDGSAEWGAGGQTYGSPCWNKRWSACGRRNKAKTGQQAVELMKEYDAVCNWTHADYLGEL